MSSLSCSQEDFNRAQNILSILNPSPALSYNFKNAEHVIPDIIVEQFKGKWHVNMNNAFVPKLKLNSNYKKMLNKEKIGNNTKTTVNEIADKVIVF